MLAVVIFILYSFSRVLNKVIVLYCCVRFMHHATYANNSQHCWLTMLWLVASVCMGLCWWLSKEAMHSGKYSKTTALRVRKCWPRENSRGQHCCGSMQTGATLLRYVSPVQNNWNVGTYCAKSLTGFKLYATSANIVVVPCNMLGLTMLRVVG